MLKRRGRRLSVDFDVQKAGHQALAGGTGRGAFVVMNVRNGEVVALGSQPSFDPNIFAKVIRRSDYRRLSGVFPGSLETNGIEHDPRDRRASCGGEGGPSERTHD